MFFAKLEKSSCVLYAEKSFLEFPLISFRAYLPAMTSFNQVNVSLFPFRFFSLYYKTYFIFLFYACIIYTFYNNNTFL